ncbi:MAG: DUF1800 family protein [Candidatus Hydrogenedentes bacterium]|nr:DUF1800 family protein [Candidatus Hydrogenedentota bacterium]
MALLDDFVGPLNNADASHLLRRAGFGGTPTERAALTGLTAAAAVAYLVEIQPTDPHLDQPGTPGTGSFGSPLADLPDDPVVPGSPTLIELDHITLKQAQYPHGLRGHWMYRMRYTSQPFQEQLALFLHDHMPSEIEKLLDVLPNDVLWGNDGDPGNLVPPGEVQTCNLGLAGVPYDPYRKHEMVTRLLRDQNYLFRSEGVNRFEDLLLAVVRDPAMLVYLDNYLNVAGRPQENLARELMELFSLGVGNYSENDIQQIAKCLTGESFPNFRCETTWDTTSGFIPLAHEPGGKFIFGSTAIPYNAAGAETEMVIQAILQKQSVTPNIALPGAAMYMAWKLCRWFVNENIELNPPSPIVVELATYLMGDDAGVYPARRYPYDIKAAMGKLFRSQFFFDSANRFAIHKHPADYIIGALRALEMVELFSIGEGLNDQMRFMGMDLFQPPDVSGWHHGQAWLSAAALVARYNWANRLCNVIMADSGVALLIDAYPVSNNDHAGMIDHLADRLFHEPLSTDEENRLLDFLNTMPLTGLGGNAIQEKRRKIRGAVHVMLSMPRAQLK